MSFLVAVYLHFVFFTCCVLFIMNTCQNCGFGFPVFLSLTLSLHLSLCSFFSSPELSTKSFFRNLSKLPPCLC